MENDFIAMEISGGGMRAQRQRMAVIAENIANQHTTGPNGPYVRKEAIFEATPVSTFDSDLQQALAVQDDPNAASYSTVRVSEVRPDGSDPVKVYDPKHPHADGKGYVAYPNVSIFREMTDMMEASRSYEANLAATKAAQGMIQAALEHLV